MKKIEICGDITEEAGVIMVFTKMHEQLGFPHLVPSSARGFDIASIKYCNMNQGTAIDVTVEFEYKSSNYLRHGHQNVMEPDRKYVVICWEDDCGLVSQLKDYYDIELYDLIELRKYVNVIHDYESFAYSYSKKPLYVILAYNQSAADNKDFGEWASVNCYKTPTSFEHPKFANDSLPAGSKVLFYQKGYIIGGFTVVRYEVIEEPKNKREKDLYRKLTNYPISLYTLEDNEWYYESRGHIFYTDFFDARDFKIEMSKYIDKKMSHHGKINITKEEYYKMIGH